MIEPGAMPDFVRARATEVPIVRFRLLVSLPVSLLIVGLLLVSAASFVAAVEGPSPSGSGAIPVDDVADREVASVRAEARTRTGAKARTEAGIGESRCDVLRREIHGLSHEVTPCALAPECHGSPLLCPVALDVQIEREYERLRDALQAQCGMPRGLLDFAWEIGAQTQVAERCELAHDGWEAAARGESAPSSYSF
jgi:hypothetical protein